MTNENFGQVLKEARLDAGLSTSAVASRLRIRNDIVIAIENSDIKHMPPQSYSKNMVAAYARLLNIDDRAVVRGYTDAIYAQDIEKARDRVNRTDIYSSRHSSNAPSEQTVQTARDLRHASKNYSSSRPSASNVPSSNRQMFSAYDDVFPETKRTAASVPRPTGYRRSSDLIEQNSEKSNKRKRRNTRSAKRSALPARSYNNAVYGQNSSKKIVVILAAVLVLILAIFGITKLVGAFSSNDSTTTKNVSGLTDPESNGISSTTTTTNTPIAPTAAVFSYEVPTGVTAWITIYLDESPTATLDKEITGPAHDTYDVTGSLTFVTYSSEVTITVGGSKVTPTQKSSGAYVYDLNFETYLAEWQAKNLTSDTDESSSDSSTATTDSTSLSSTNTSGTSSVTVSSGSSSTSSSTSSTQNTLKR